VAGAFYLGNNQAATNTLRGVFAEVIVFNRALTEGERGQVEQYLAKKWQLYPARAIASPLEIPNCAMWFDASQGITYDGNGVSQWNDSSGNARHIVQSVNANKPTYNPSNAAFGGKATIDWDTVGNGDRLERGSADTLAQPLTIFAVANMANASSTNIALFANVSGADLSFQRFSGTQWIFVGGQPCYFPTPTFGTRPFLATIVANTTDSRVALNGQLVTANHINGGVSALGTFRLGSMYNTFQAQNWNGSIAEFIIFTRRLTDGELTLVEQYLARKYNL